MLKTNLAALDLGAVQSPERSLNLSFGAENNSEEFSQHLDTQVKKLESGGEKTEPERKTEISRNEVKERSESPAAKETSKSAKPEEAGQKAEKSDSGNGKTLPQKAEAEDAAAKTTAKTEMTGNDGEAEAKMQTAESSLQQMNEALLANKKLGESGEELTSEESAEALLAVEGEELSEEELEQSLLGMAQQTQQQVQHQVQHQGKVDSSELAAQGQMAQGRTDAIRRVDDAVREAIQTMDLEGEEGEELQWLARNRDSGPLFGKLLKNENMLHSLLAAANANPNGRHFDQELSLQMMSRVVAMKGADGATPMVTSALLNPNSTFSTVSSSLTSPINMPLNQPGWGRAVAERVMFMVNGNVQEAEIKLNPRELGPIGIRVTLNQDQANVSFVAQHATTREALEAAIPRLREMLGENGLQLGQSDVSQHSFKGNEQQMAGEGRGRGHGHADGDEGDESLMVGAGGLRKEGYVSPSGVDFFA